MSLPNPLPDNPHRWEGWRTYNSANYYERLGLSFDSNASTEQIEENCRMLLVWWQKKLPLKNQPSNPLSQLLRVGMDEAPTFLVEARTALLDPALRNDAAERFFANTGADIRHGGNQAFYAPGPDYVQMPPFAAFRDAESYA